MYKIINVHVIYSMYTNCIKFRPERVGLDGRVVSGSDLIPLQYVFKDLVLNSSN